VQLKVFSNVAWAFCRRREAAKPGVVALIDFHGARRQSVRMH